MQFRVNAWVALLGCAASVGVIAAGKSSIGSQLSGMNPSTVFDGHDRFPLDPSSLPQVGRLNFTIGDPGKKPSGASCTGELVGVRSVLTAAHCVVDTLSYNSKLDAYNQKVKQYNQNLDDDEDPVPLAKPRTIVFLPGLITEALPKGAKPVEADMSQVWVGDFNPNLQARTLEQALKALIQETPGDYAILTLKETPSNAQFKNLGSLPISTEPLKVGTSLISVGYAGDYDNARTAGVDDNCHVRQVFANGTIFHDCAIEHGASGGPLLTETINGTLVTADNEKDLRTQAMNHPDQVQIAYQIVGVITSEIPVQQQNGFFGIPGFGFGFGDDQDQSVTYSAQHPNIANGVVNVATDLTDALKHEQDAGVQASGPAPVFHQEIQAAKLKRVDDRGNRGDDGDDDGGDSF